MSKKRELKEINLSMENPLFAGVTGQEDGKVVYVLNGKLEAADPDFYDDLKFIYYTLAEVTGVTDPIPFNEKGTETLAFKFRNGDVDRIFTPSVYKEELDFGARVVIRWGNQLFPIKYSLAKTKIEANKLGQQYTFSSTVVFGKYKDRALGLKFIQGDDKPTLRMWFRLNLEWVDDPANPGKKKDPGTSIEILTEDFIPDPDDETGATPEAFLAHLKTYDPSASAGGFGKVRELPPGVDLTLVDYEELEVKRNGVKEKTYILHVLDPSTGEVTKVWSTYTFTNKINAGLRIRVKDLDMDNDDPDSRESQTTFQVTPYINSRGKPTARVDFDPDTLNWSKRSNVLVLD